MKLSRLGNLIGLASRTIVLPFLQTLWYGSDRSIYDQAGVLRNVNYWKPDEVSPLEFKRVRRRLGVEPPVFTILLGFILALSAYNMYRASRLATLGAGTIASSAAIVLLFLWSVYVYFRRLGNFAPAKLVVIAWVHEGRCPSCAHPLSPDAGDKLPTVTCSECAGVWPRAIRSTNACIGCGYSQEGIERSKVCPECGMTW